MTFFVQLYLFGIDINNMTERSNNCLFCYKIASQVFRNGLSLIYLPKSKNRNCPAFYAAGNYPDTYKSVYRDWGWQKENY